MNILSAILSLIAVILESIVLFHVKDLPLYGNTDDSHLTAVELQPISSPINEPDGNVFFHSSA